MLLPLLLTDISRLFSWQTVLTKKGVHQTKKSTEWHTHWIYLLLSNCYCNDGSSQRSRQQKSYNPKKVLLLEKKVGRSSTLQIAGGCSNFWHSAPLAWYMVYNMRQVFPCAKLSCFFVSLGSDLVFCITVSIQSFEQMCEGCKLACYQSSLMSTEWKTNMRGRDANFLLASKLHSFQSPTVCKGLCLSKEKMDQVHFL